MTGKILYNRRSSSFD